MNVTLPEGLREWVETQAQLGGHPSVDCYVETVLRDERERTRKEIDQLLLEGVESGEPVEVNEIFWAARRRHLEECVNNHAKQRG